MYAKLNYAKIDIINFISIPPIIFDFLPHRKRHFHIKFSYCEKVQNFKKNHKLFFEITYVTKWEIFSKLCSLFRTSESYAGVYQYGPM